MNLAELAQGPVTVSHKSIVHSEAHGDVIKAQFSLISKTKAQVSNFSISIPVDSQTPPKPFIFNSKPTNPQLPKTQPFPTSLKIKDPRPRVYQRRTLPRSFLSEPKQRGTFIKEAKKRLWSEVEMASRRRNSKKGGDEERKKLKGSHAADCTDWEVERTITNPQVIHDPEEIQKVMRLLGVRMKMKDGDSNLEWLNQKVEELR
ncbi:hypothetical protein FRX31_003720 [Thalictrum thalictroides]|uniref:Uncharacterized protein n=1 Tax=Thalictrum thalictroides TaxID=46969 RepID=A0A7J6XA63_THATH|nr:hypothetical protein FRX31_003720 [Thalictrum thalictroides]